MNDKRKKELIIGIGIAVVILIVVGILILTTINDDSSENINDENENQVSDEVEEETFDKNDQNIINELQIEINSTADSEIYEIEEEYDGRLILQIKDDVQYETVLAGILKGGMPTLDEIDALIETAPTEVGIWISSNSQERFAEILENNGVTDYEIDEDGYLHCEEIEEQANSEKLYIIDINGTSYIRSYLTGEVEEYQFELMDPYQTIDPYYIDSSTILEITTDPYDVLTDEEIFEDILLNMT